MKQTERDRVNEEMVRKYGEINAQYGLSEVTTLEDALNLDIETGEHMRLNLSSLDRIIWEEAQTISDGKALFEHTPSSLTPHHRYGMRLNKKYRAGKRAFLAAYMLYMVSGIEQESREWFEALCEESFDSAFKQLFELHSELRKCDVRDTDVMGKIESGVGDGSLYHAVEIIGGRRNGSRCLRIKSLFTASMLRRSAGPAGTSSELSEKSFMRRKGLPIMK